MTIDEQDNNAPRRGISRRDFIGGVLAAAGAATVVGNMGNTALADDNNGFVHRTTKTLPQIPGPVQIISKPGDNLIKIQCPVDSGGSKLLLGISRGTNEELVSSVVSKEGEKLIWRTTLYGQLPNGMKPGDPNAQPNFSLHIDSTPADVDKFMDQKGAIKVYQDVLGGDKISLGNSNKNTEGNYATENNNPNATIVIEIDVTQRYRTPGGKGR